MTSFFGASYRIVGRRELRDRLASRDSELARDICGETIWRQGEPAGPASEKLARQVKLAFLARVWHRHAGAEHRGDASLLREILGPPPLDEARFDRFFEITRTPPPDEELEGVLEELDETAMSV